MSNYTIDMYQNAKYITIQFNNNYMAQQQIESHGQLHGGWGQVYMEVSYHPAWVEVPCSHHVYDSTVAVLLLRKYRYKTYIKYRF